MILAEKSNSYSLCNLDRVPAWLWKSDGRTNPLKSGILTLEVCFSAKKNPTLKSSTELESVMYGAPILPIWRKNYLHTRSLGPCDSLPPVWPLAPPIWPNLLSHFFQLISHNFPLYLWIRISTLLHQSFTVKRWSQLVCLTSCLSAVILLAISCLCTYLSTFLILEQKLHFRRDDDYGRGGREGCPCQADTVAGGKCLFRKHTLKIGESVHHSEIKLGNKRQIKH